MPANGSAKPFVGINLAKNKISHPQIFSTQKWTRTPPKKIFNKIFQLVLFILHSTPVSDLLLMRGQSRALFYCTETRQKRFWSDSNLLATKFFRLILCGLHKSQNCTKVAQNRFLRDSNPSATKFLMSNLCNLTILTDEACKSFFTLSERRFTGFFCFPTKFGETYQLTSPERD